MKNLSKDLEFTNAFLLACHRGNAKYCSTAVQCLHRLIICKAVPVTKIELTLDALMESTQMAVDIQLKILQCLPFVFQNYSLFIFGGTLSKLLYVCSLLQSANKTPAVINTASATFLQLVGLVFEKAAEREETPVAPMHVVPVDDEETIEVSESAFDAQRVLLDLCALIEHHKPSFLRTNYITEEFGLEVLESVIKNNTALFAQHKELGFVLRTRVVPILLRYVSSSRDFSLMVRVFRVIFLILKELFSVIVIESEVILSLVTHTITSQAGSVLWKRILCGELFWGILRDFSLVRQIVSECDLKDEPVLTTFIATCLEILLDQKDTLNSGEALQPHPMQLGLDPSLLPDEESRGGLFTHQCTVKVRFIDLLDKQEAPKPPPAYFYYVLMMCFCSLSEGIGKATIDLNGDTITFLDENSFPTDPSKRETLEFARMVTSLCWDQLRNGLRLFLFATLDNELFNRVLRSLQKLCHACGILGLKEPRNAILKEFALACVNLTGNIGPKETKSFRESLVGTISSTINQAATTLSGSSQQVAQVKDFVYPRNVSSRHIVCFRVLISLTISLGSILGDQWETVLMTYQWMDFFLNGSPDFTSDPSVLLEPHDVGAYENVISKLHSHLQNYSTDTFHEILSSVSFLFSKLVKSPSAEANCPIFENALQPCRYNVSFYLALTTHLLQADPRKFILSNDSNYQATKSFLVGCISDRDLAPQFRLEVTHTFTESWRSIAEQGIQDPHFAQTTEDRVLDSLVSCVVGLADLPLPEQLLVLNCETEVYLQVLDTLNQLLDAYGNGFTHCWEAVFQMLTAPLRVTRLAEKQESDSLLRTKLTLVVRRCFETLKLVLDEFLTAIPKPQTKVLIDCLYNFVDQEFDLNISFNSTSYFWLISDQVKSDPLWNYLLLQLARTTHDTRLEVRNGSVQTFFSIIDSHGETVSQWYAIYDEVLRPIFLSVEFPREDEWVSTLTLVLQGTTKLFSTFFTDAIQTERLWEGLVDWWAKLVQLNWTALDLKVFQCLKQVIQTPFPDVIFHHFFVFWCNYSISFNFAENNLYQETLTELMQCFPFLLTQLSPSASQLSKILTMINACARYPVLPDFSNDSVKCTPLQSASLENISLLRFPEPELASLVVQQLIGLVTLPFTRDQLQEKLSNYRVPSFIAISSKAVLHLKASLDLIQDITPLVEDKCILKVYKSLQKPISSRSPSSAHTCMEILVSLDERLPESPLDVWSLAIDTLEVTLASDSNDVGFDSGIYTRMRRALLSKNLPRDLLTKLVLCVWRYSFVYEKDEFESHVFSGKENPAEVTQSLANFDFGYFGSTERIRPLNRLSLRLQCLNDLIDFAQSKELSAVASPYFACRAAFSLRKFVADAKISGLGPLPEIQTQEVGIILNGLIRLSKQEDMSSLRPLVVQCVSYHGKANLAEVLRELISAMVMPSSEAMKDLGRQI